MRWHSGRWHELSCSSNSTARHQKAKQQPLSAYTLTKTASQSILFSRRCALYSSGAPQTTSSRVSAALSAVKLSKVVENITTAGSLVSTGSVTLYRSSTALAAICSLYCAVFKSCCWWRAHSHNQTTRKHDRRSIARNSRISIVLGWKFLNMLTVRRDALQRCY